MAQTNAPGTETNYGNGLTGPAWVDYATETDETVKAKAYTNANNANGLAFPLSNSQSELYFTQKQRFDHAWLADKATNAAGFSLLQWRRDRYEDWEKMHSNILWFDTSACLGFGHIGNVNEVTIRPDTTRYQRRGTGNDAPCDATAQSDGSSDCFQYVAAEANNWWTGSSWS